MLREHEMNRRDFLRAAVAAPLAGTGLAAAFTADPSPAADAPPTTAPAAPPLGKKYTTALIGAGWWGTNILHCAIEAGQSQVVALGDVDRRQGDRLAADVERLTGTRPKLYADYRELLEKEKPEISIVATPDHWHPLIMIAAVRAGSHVYVEKPISHTVKEGRAMVNAARASDRVVQVGTHRRVSPHNISGMEFLKSGKAGKIGMVRAFVDYGGGPGRPTPDSAVPDGLDWNLWLGPAPVRPYNRNIHPKGFRQYLDFANGQIGDWGVHWLDQILWWTDEKFPHTVYSSGGRPIKRDGTDAPDSQIAVYQFKSFTAMWEHRLYAGNEAEKSNIGCYFYGTEGTFHMGWLDGWTFYPSDTRKPTIHQPAQLHQPDSQNIRELWADFLAAIPEGKRPVCDIEKGHRATTMALLGMLSLKLGRSIVWDGDNETIIGDVQANRMLSRPYRTPWEYPTV